jgi:hypothetical protein
MSNLLVFGAGASAHSGPCIPRNPTEGNMLFAELSKTGIARKLAPRFGKQFQANFEDGMAAVRAEEDESTAALLRQIGAYLSSFAPDSGNFFIALFKSLFERGVTFRIATLNYDLLIERAL